MSNIVCFVGCSSDESPLGQALPPGFPAPFLFADGLSSVETLLTNIQVTSCFTSQTKRFIHWCDDGEIVLRVFKAGVWLFQGLLKVAVENARVQDKQIQAEKRELKMELYREREMRESLERQLTSELQSRGTTLNPERCFQNDDAERNLLYWNYNRVSSSASIQKRLKKEKKAKRKLQEALEFESKRRERVEDALKHSSSSSPSPEPLHAANNNTKNGTLDGMCVGLFCASSWPPVFHLPAASVCLKSSSSLFLLTCSSLLFSSCLVWLFF